MSLERAARWALWWGGAAGAVAVLRLALGPVLAALVLGPVLWLAIVCTWWSIERRHPLPSLPYHPPAAPRLERPAGELPAAQRWALEQLAELYLDHVRQTEAQR